LGGSDHAPENADERGQLRPKLRPALVSAVVLAPACKERQSASANQWRLRRVCRIRPFWPSGASITCRCVGSRLRLACSPGLALTSRRELAAGVRTSVLVPPAQDGGTLQEVGVVERCSEEQSVRLEALPRRLPLGVGRASFASAALTMTLDLARGLCGPPGFRSIVCGHVSGVV
jgi:hypothetical protein